MRRTHQRKNGKPEPTDGGIRCGTRRKFDLACYLFLMRRGITVLSDFRRAAPIYALSNLHDSKTLPPKIRCGKELSDMARVPGRQLFTKTTHAESALKGEVAGA